MEEIPTFYTSDRNEWRKWLMDNFETKTVIWFVFPMKESKEKCLEYNDAVEEALCFGWIDSTIKHIDSLHRAQRFSPRNPTSKYSRANIERLIVLENKGMLHPRIRESVLPIINEPYVYPVDILKEINRDSVISLNFAKMPAAYKRIRVGYIDAARKRPQEFKRRLDNFLEKTRSNQLVKGFGGIDKYYKQ